MSGPDVLTFGGSLVSLRSAGPLASGGTLSMHLAGAEANVAIALARLGHRAAWAGRVGTDELGAFVLRHLRAEGVQVDGVARDPERPPGPAGARAHTRDGAQHTEALAVTAVDTVGAGEAFTVSTRGDWEGLPRRHELSLLDGHETGSTIR